MPWLPCAPRSDLRHGFRAHQGFGVGRPGLDCLSHILSHEHLSPRRRHVSSDHGPWQTLRVCHGSCRPVLRDRTPRQLRLPFAPLALTTSDDFWAWTGGSTWAWTWRVGFGSGSGFSACSCESSHPALVCLCFRGDSRQTFLWFGSSSLPTLLQYIRPLNH